ncbi:MAG TPA: transmembrane 220 family protein [Kofleriaceae bacterium]|nr:transmembrane 220 family protein [Kofleriaceae bacterium]
MKHSGVLVALNILFAALFVVSAGLQYNDPDPWRWVALYGGAAVATVAALHVRGGWIAAVLVGVVAAVWAATLWYSVSGHVEVTDFWRKMSEKGGKVEEMREAGGLSIVAGWLAVSSRAGWRNARRR